jgi:hypothetical protein
LRYLHPATRAGPGRAGEGADRASLESTDHSKRQHHVLPLFVVPALIRAF